MRDLLTATGKNADFRSIRRNLTAASSCAEAGPRAERLIEQINNAPFNPAANYYVVTRDPLDVTSATSQIFLGVRIECARCHNHPFEKWTQNDYYGLAAFFTRHQRPGRRTRRRAWSPSTGAPRLRHPKTNQVVEPRTLDGADAQPGRRARTSARCWPTG